MGKFLEREIIEEMQEVAEREVLKGKHNGDVKVREMERRYPSYFVGYMNTDGAQGKINIGFNPEYEESHPGKTSPVIRDITRHEINHVKYDGFNGCPRNPDNHVELIFEPIADVLSEKRFNANDVHYIANCLEDTVLHSDLSEGFELEGINDFFKNIGECKNDKKFSDFYEAHTRLNLFLWGNKKQKKQLGKYWRCNKRVNKAISNFLQRTGISDLTKDIDTYERRKEIWQKGEKQVVERKDIQKKARDRKGIRNFLNNQDNWPQIARIYAEEFSELMDPGYAMPILNHSGKGTKGRETEKSEETIEGNLFDRQMHHKDYKRKRVEKAYRRNEQSPVWMDSFETLDLVYQSLAQKLNVNAETFTESEQMPIYHYGRREFDPEKDKLKKVKFGFDDKANIRLEKKKYYESTPLQVKFSPKGFPEIRFGMIDTSSSMGEDPNGGDNVGKTSIIPWGDNSKYHYALLGWYGLLEYLKQRGLLNQTGIALGNFSNQTYVAKGLEKAKRLALSPQFRGTRINMDSIENIFRNRDMLVFTLSDGEIENWETIKEDFIRKAGEHYYFHLQMGGSNRMTEDLEDAGLGVFYVGAGHDLVSQVIEITDKSYNNITTKTKNK